MAPHPLTPNERVAVGGLLDSIIAAGPIDDTQYERDYILDLQTARAKIMRDG